MDFITQFVWIVSYTNSINIDYGLRIVAKFSLNIVTINSLNYVITRTYVCQISSEVSMYVHILYCNISTILNMCYIRIVQLKGNVVIVLLAF